MFAPETAEAGSDAKALQAAALKALAGEIDARAEKLSGAADDQFALANDGTLRWTGDAVGKLVAADSTLVPRIRIIADERLTGAPRDAVQARLDLWLKTHIEKILGPMFELQKAEDVTGIARGIAFQLVEALGVIERSRIAAEMKDLDQPSRATLRKYGVRFGAYHIYFPALLKPAARGLASLLWALKHDDIDMSALTGAQHLASSGRTSFPADKALNQEAYRTLGYKLAGERVVRVDILERLADLIRPALAWRPGTAVEKPAGAFDGRSFTVTQAMTSLTGSAGEDFASVLRALGYRMERRAPLPEEPAPAVEAATGDAVAIEPDIAATTADVADITNEGAEAPAAADEGSAASVDEGSSAAKLPGIDFVPTADEPAVSPEEVAAEAAAPAEPDVVEAPAPDVAPEVAAPEAAANQATASEANKNETATSEATEVGAEQPAAEAAPAEPELVEVWRPGGRSDERRPRHHHRHRGANRGRDAAQGAPAQEGEAAAPDGAERERHGRPRRNRGNDNRRPDREAGEGAQARGPRENRGDRPQRERFKGPKGKGKFEGKGRDNRREGGAALRTFASSAPRERDRAADPNSPFAKLAALKDQLATTRKD
jgi:ATP-dependent RNA helicase SUPV3L1/SUV3